MEKFPRKSVQELMQKTNCRKLNPNEVFARVEPTDPRVYRYSQNLLERYGNLDVSEVFGTEKRPKPIH
jgi:hypothetical protein